MDESIEAVSRIAIEAGEILLRYERSGFAISQKSENNPVTDADKASNEHVVQQLSKLFPSDTIVAEESDMPEAYASRVWYVDPLDGTKEYIAKNGEYSVMIGMAEKGTATLGVVYQPSKSWLYAGTLEAGTRFSDLKSQEHKQLRVQESPHPKWIASRSHRPAIYDELKYEVGFTEELTHGSVGLKVGLIAQGMAQAYVHMRREADLWDLCAPEVLMKAAGGCFTDSHGQDILYGTSAKPHGIIVGTPEQHPRLVTAIKTLRQRHRQAQATPQ